MSVTQQEIAAAFGQKLTAGAQAVRDHAGLQVVYFGFQLFQPCGEVIDRDRVKNGKALKGFVTLILIANCLARIDQVGNGILGDRQELLSGGGQLNRECRPINERDTNPVFQGLDPATEGRLGDVSLFCRTRETKRAPQTDEISEPI